MQSRIYFRWLIVPYLNICGNYDPQVLGWLEGRETWLSFDFVYRRPSLSDGQVSMLDAKKHLLRW